MTTGILPHSLIKELQATETKRVNLKLNQYLMLRDFIEDNEHKLRDDKMMMQLYKEAARPLRCEAETVRKNLRVIREYHPLDLRKWLDGGLSFHHIEKANALADDNRSPAFLLESAIDAGGADGQPWTVDELIEFATGDRPKWDIPKVVTGYLNKLSNLGIVKRWDEDKQGRWHKWIETGKEFFK